MKAYRPTGTPKTNEYTIDRFTGVDFTTSPMNISPMRSPDSMNIIINNKGYPQSRTGFDLKYKATYEEIEATRPMGVEPTRIDYRINGFYKVLNYDKVEEEEINDYDILIHLGDMLYNVKDMDFSNGFINNINENTIEQNEYIGRMANKKSQGMQYYDKFYIADGKEMLAYGKYDEYTRAYPLFHDSYVPTTSISRESTGGGVPYEAVNLVSPYRINEFFGDAQATTYQLDDNNINTSDYDIFVWVMDNNGNWNEKIVDEDFVVDDYLGEVTFLNPPPYPVVTKRDNVRIKYAKTYHEVNGYVADEDEYYNRISKCKNLLLYDGRMFATGNEDYPNMDWYSEKNSKIYFPDINYTYVGGNTSKITGYSILSNGVMAIHKDGNGNEPAIFYRTPINYEVDGSEIIAYRITAGAVSGGNISKGMLKQFNNDTLMMTKDGLMAIVPIRNTQYNDRYTELRSYYINNRLIKEENLEEAEGIIYNDKLYMAVNNNIYIANSSYEWNFLSDIPVRCFLEYNDRLYFGTEDGEVMFFKKADELNAYMDYKDGEYEPIKAYWKTPILNLGTFNYYKTLKNLYVVAEPFNQSKINVDYIVKSINANAYQSVLEYNNSVFDFSNIDFSNFLFDTDTSPRVIPTNYKAKKFVLIQFMIWANEGKPFGFYSLSASYTVNSKYKG